MYSSSIPFFHVQQVVGASASSTAYACILPLLVVLHTILQQATDHSSLWSSALLVVLHTTYTWCTWYTTCTYYIMCTSCSSRCYSCIEGICILHTHHVHDGSSVAHSLVDGRYHGVVIYTPSICWSAWRWSDWRWSDWGCWFAPCWFRHDLQN